MPTCPFCRRDVPTLSSVCPHCLRALPLSVTTARATSPSRSLSLGWVRPLLLVFVAGTAAAYAYRTWHHEAPPEPVPEPVMAPATTTTIAPPLDVPIADTASVVLPAGGHLAYTFSGGGRSGCRVRGTIQARSGDRRIRVFVVDRDGLANVENGRTPRTYYDSGGVPDVALDINLDGRTEYTLVVAHAGGGRRASTVRLRQVVASCSD